MDAHVLVSPPLQTRNQSFGVGLWRLADPKISLASFSAMFLGACAAAGRGPLSMAWLGLTVAGIFAIEVAKNASGEIVDFESGADIGIAPEDRSPFSGGKRVLVDGLLTRRETGAIAFVFYALGIAAGLEIVLNREPRVLPFGVVGLACAFFYHAPPVKLSYRGFGEAAVGLCYGPLIACGTYLVQRGRVSLGVLLASVPLGFLIAAFLWINEFPDYRADLRAGKRTLVVRLGRPRAATVFAGLVGAAFAIQALLPLASHALSLGIPRSLWLGFLGLVPAVASVLGLREAPEKTVRIIPAQRRILLAFLLLAAGSGIGFLLR
jgi:1,4-dihydroxy-2-naphthoate octaprenyltransferase